MILDQKRLLDVGCDVPIGTVFSRLTTIGVPFAVRSLPCGKRHAAVVVQCECGTVIVARVPALRSRKVRSCGCLARDLPPSGLRHGQSSTRLYRVWCGIRDRCGNPRSTVYHYYGGRGIRVCDEWQRFEAFQAWAEQNGYAEGLQIDRINTDGNYEPQNCRWVTQVQNIRNRRSTKLTATRVALARLAVASGVPRKNIAAALGVTSRNLNYALRGDSWGSVPVRVTSGAAQ